ncbi:hypothetical protein ABE10_02115, partial [Bacillus toyonensis]|nr:hypothetical protein [Bacillus toyonensis]
GAAPDAGVHHSGEPEEHDERCEHPPQVPEPVVREEVRIDERREDDRGPPGRIAGEAEVEQAVHAHHVRADRRVHEPAEQRH